MAEAVFKSMCPSDYHVDSAGTAGFHIGSSPDPRTLSTIKKHNLFTTHRAQQLSELHFDEFDYIICMDKSNLNEAAKMQPRLSKAKCIPVTFHLFKVMLFGDVLEDPYYGDIEGFERNYVQCIKNSENLLRILKKNLV